MNTDEDKQTNCCKDKHVFKNHSVRGGDNALYGLGVVGALFYFLKGATSFMAIITGIGKAFFWPAILMFKLLTYLKM